jgi:hypothetical protein
MVEPEFITYDRATGLRRAAPQGLLYPLIALMLSGCAGLNQIGSTIPPYRAGQEFVSASCIVSEFPQPCRYAFHLVRDRAAHVLLLAKISSRDASGLATFSVTDFFSPIPFKPGHTLALGTCGSGGEPDASIFAIVESQDGAPDRVTFAMHANIVSGRLEKVDGASLKCTRKGTKPFVAPPTTG